ncbi:hypothetical protein TELCIR_23025, partial [Teladorsagia circumcincta]
PTHFFSVCVAPIYGSEPKWLSLAELIEHYKLQVSLAFYPTKILDTQCSVPFAQGATYFYVYTKYIDEYSRVLLDDYIRTGEAEAVILHDRFERADDRWQEVQLQAEMINYDKGRSQMKSIMCLLGDLSATLENTGVLGAPR